MSEPKIISRKDFEAKIVAHAWRDAKYKQRLLKNPKAVVEEALQEVEAGAKLPGDLKVAVHEESPSQYHLVLPTNPNDIAPGLVADAQLEAVAPQTIAVVVVSGPSMVAQVVGITTVQTNAQMAWMVATIGNVASNVTTTTVA